MTIFQMSGYFRELKANARMKEVELLQVLLQNIENV